MPNSIASLKIIFDAIISRQSEVGSGYNDFVYPYGIDEVRRRLFTHNNIYLLKDYFAKTMPEEYSAYCNFIGTIATEGYNPHKRYVVFEDLFTPNYTVNDLVTVFNLFEIKQPGTLVLVGDKGSGKTITQNCWLEINKHKMEDMKIIWTRCDAHKLYRLWEDAIAKMGGKVDDLSSLVSITDYLNMQFLYVFCKYRNAAYQDGTSTIIMKAMDHISIKYAHDTFLYRPSRRGAPISKSIIDSINEEGENIVKFESQVADKGFSYVLDVIMKNSQLATHNIAKSNWISLSNKIQKILAESGYGFLFLLDGVDNIDNPKRNENSLYELMKQQAGALLYKTPPFNHVVLACMREKTFYEIEVHLQKDTRDATNPIVVDHHPSDMNMVLKKRIEYYKSNNNDTSFGRVIADMLDHRPVPENSLYHNNIRTYLHNSATLANQVLYRLLQLDLFDNYSDETIENQTNTLHDRNLFLNGRLSMRTMSDAQLISGENGRYSFNPFYWNTNRFPCSKIENWYGLLTTRLMQYLIAFAGGVEERDVIDNINRYFTYPLNLIEMRLDELKYFGMADTIKPTPNTLRIVISEKGRYFYKKIYSDINNLYYFALDTYLPSKFVMSDNFQIHDNGIKHNTHYRSRAVVTGLSFLSFIIGKHNQEMGDMQLRQILTPELTKLFMMPYRKHLFDNYENETKPTEIYVDLRHTVVAGLAEPVFMQNIEDEMRLLRQFTAETNVNTILRL